MKDNKLNYVDVAYMTDAEAQEWANKNEGTFAVGDNGGVLQMFIAHFHEANNIPNPKDVGFVLSMCNEPCNKEVQITITDFSEMKRLRDYLNSVIGKYEEAKINDENSPCYKCAYSYSCNEPNKAIKKCEKYIKCPF